MTPQNIKNSQKTQKGLFLKTFKLIIMVAFFIGMIIYIFINLFYLLQYFSAASILEEMYFQYQFFYYSSQVGLYLLCFILPVILASYANKSEYNKSKFFIASIVTIIVGFLGMIWLPDLVRQSFSSLIDFSYIFDFIPSIIPI